MVQELQQTNPEEVQPHIIYVRAKIMKSCGGQELHSLCVKMYVLADLRGQTPPSMATCYLTTIVSRNTLLNRILHCQYGYKIYEREADEKLRWV